MPGLPSQWVVGGNPTDAPVSAGRLNYDMYTYDSNEFHPTGVYYATYRPLFYEILAPVAGSLTAGSTAAGARNVISATTLNFAETLYDTSGAWGAGADTLQGVYQFLPTVPGSDGGGNIGGYYVMCGFLEMSGSNAGSRVLGCDLEYWNGSAGSLVTTGSHQSMVTNHNNTAFYMDLIPTGPNAASYGIPGGYGAGFTYLDACFISDTSLATYTAVGPSTGDTSGETSRHWDFWAAINNGTGWGGQSTIGSPKASWPSGTSITSTVLQNSLANPLTWLGNPVAFRAASNATGVTLASNTATKINFPAGAGTTITNGLGNFGTSTYTYTIPVAGLYLFHGVVSLTGTTFTGALNTGARINGSEIYWGPSYAGNATTANVISATKTQIFSLQAGDTVELMGRQSSTGGIAVATGFQSRFMLTWLGDNGAAIGGSGNIGSPVTTYTVPDPSFRWQAGTPGSVLQPQFQQHLGNDIGFLFNRPYFMGYQTTATSLSTTGAWSNAGTSGIPLDTQKGAVHGDNGDPWARWKTAASTNWWTAPVNGWYLVVSEVTAATTNAPTDLTAGLSATTSGGRTPSTKPDWYQHILLSTSPALPNGSTSAGLYYLLAGESVYTAGKCNGQSAAAVTSVDMSAPAWSTTHMEVVWLGA